jgi:hypothetical protein
MIYDNYGYQIQAHASQTKLVIVSSRNILLKKFIFTYILSCVLWTLLFVLLANYILPSSCGVVVKRVTNEHALAVVSGKYISRDLSWRKISRYVAWWWRELFYCVYEWLHDKRRRFMHGMLELNMVLIPVSGYLGEQVGCGSVWK